MMNRNRHRSCNLCGGYKPKILFKFNKLTNGKEVSIIKCQNCGLIYKDPLSNSETEYKNNHHIANRNDYPDEITASRIELYKDLIKEITPFKKLNRVLDVGMGAGLFLQLCSERGWNVFGTEIRSEFIDPSKGKYDNQVFLGTLDEIGFEKDFFDAIVFNNVLEHVSDPAMNIKEAIRIVRPGGAILFRFPNALLHVPMKYIITKIQKVYKKAEKFDHFVVHSYSFSKSTIHLYLRKLGLNEILIKNSTRQATAYEKTLYFILIKILAKVIALISFGKLLIGSSLSIKTIKPIK